MDDVESLHTEFKIISDIEELQTYSNKSFDEFWSKVFDMKSELDEDMFPNLTKLLKGLMCLLHS